MAHGPLLESSLLVLESYSSVSSIVSLRAVMVVAESDAVVRPPAAEAAVVDR